MRSGKGSPSWRQVIFVTRELRGTDVAAIHLAHEFVAVGSLCAARVDAREGRLDAEARTCQQSLLKGDWMLRPASGLGFRV